MKFVTLCIDMIVDNCDGHCRGLKDVRVKERSQGAKSLECVMSSSVRSANSKPELSQLLFISIKQKELVKSSCWIGLSTYTNATWSVHYFPTLPCDLVTCDHDVTL